MRGVEALLATRVPVNLRMVVDRDNLPALPAVAELTESRGWLDLPEKRSKTQVGRNYELFGCASRQAPVSLFGRADLWAAWLELPERHAAPRPGGPAAQRASRAPGPGGGACSARLAGQPTRPPASPKNSPAVQTLEVSGQVPVRQPMKCA